MYIPKYFKVTDFNEITEFVSENSFGTIVTTNNGKPIATHIPLEFSKEGEDYFITGHMAYGNPQWRTFDTCEEALVIYQGPHAYISSSWYEHENVSTWNYQAVHVYGKATRMEADKLKQDLSKLQEKYEKHRKNAILWENLSPEFLENQLKGVVGFKIKVREIQAAYKLSQNRNEEDYLNIIDELQKEENINSKRMAEIMKKRVNDK
ncbi:FMN-binding negative transcriptional regulator [Lysinibacillus telephonicus]|uniref:FMN-binding negative transcriptional regulator n=1 Tax=Lysinibacillus telephonicus TaxID=1714840 RepID=A0A431UR16_9BACI|nr:FMN-binding negative transcriptional regulator [Lysinibacillus telephonicus]RTQ92625.1 FMN-binding negative transcriptional regulator [Lysinibacillus telephonicus]